MKCYIAMKTGKLNATDVTLSKKKPLMKEHSHSMILSVKSSKIGKAGKKPG